MASKMVIVGNSNSGKTNLMTRFTDNVFTKEYNETAAAEFRSRTINNVKFQVHDMPNNSKFKTIMSAYYRGAQAVIITFDLTNRDSFNNLPYWISETKKFNNKAVIVLVGTKSDLNQQINDEEVKQLYEYRYIKISSKDRINIDLLFSEIIWAIKTKNAVKNSRF